MNDSHAIRYGEMELRMHPPAWLPEAKSHWDCNRAYAAGLLICNHMGLDQLPFWAADILRFTRHLSGNDHPILEQAEQLARNPLMWKQGHDLFSEVRDITLAHDRLSKQTPINDMLGWILAVAELTTKVSYNATSPPDEFDEDSASWLVACLHGFASTMNDPCILQEAWQIASSGLATKHG